MDTANYDQEGVCGVTKLEDYVDLYDLKWMIPRIDVMFQNITSQLNGIQKSLDTLNFVLQLHLIFLIIILFVLPCLFVNAFFRRLLGDGFEMIMRRRWTAARARG